MATEGLACTRMRKRLASFRPTLVLLLVALAGCMGDEEKRMEVAYGVVRDDVPTRIIVVEDDGTDGRRVSGARRGHSPVLPKWSPDGRRIAFVRFNPLGGPGSLQVYVVNADGSGERRLGEGTLPVWTRDGRFLIVERTAAPPKPSTLHVISVDGGGERRLTLGSGPALSHRGSRIAFIRQTYRRTADGKYEVASASLHTISLDGTGLRRVARVKGRLREPAWLPNDSAIAVLKGGLGGPLITVSTNGRQRVVVPKVDETYDWSPKGDLIAYTQGGLLYIVRPDGTEVDAYGQSNAIDIEWSPDGKKVAFTVQEVLQTEAEFIGIYTIDLEKQERRRFVLADGFVAYLDWRPILPDDD
jgi:TolB protein